MKFAEKLDFLMNMTKMTNSALARYLVFDTSYVSRMRSGKRLIPKDAGIVHRMAGYFAERLTDNTSKNIVIDIMKTAPSNSFKSTIAAWLLRDDEKAEQVTSGQVVRFLDNLSGFTAKTPPSEGDPADLFSVTDEVMSVHYGIEGKRRAVVLFLSEVALRDKPQTLLLHSSEEMSWMVGDPVFTQKWVALMFAVLSKGNRIKIIHTIDRGIDEMLDSIASWMPVYMTGLIEPYYYQKKRDNIFKQTMFIAPETAAVISHSVNDKTENAPNTLYRDTAVVAAYVEEYNEFLSMCRPLLQIFTGRDTGAFLHMLNEFEKGEVDAIEKTTSLSSLTMPKALLIKFLENAGDDEAQKILDVHNFRVGNFKKLLKTRRYTEIISLPDIQKLINGEVKADMSVLMKGGIDSYTPQNYIKHLQSIIALLKANINYHIHIATGPLDSRYIVYCRDNVGVIVAKTSQPPIALASSESQLIAAFWDFLKHTIGNREYDHPNNEKVIERLQEYIAEVKEAVKAVRTKHIAPPASPVC